MIENVLPHDEVPDEKRRGCSDCRHLQGAVTWWCFNTKAAIRRGTRLPGAIDCPQWEPARVALPPMWLRLQRWWDALFGKRTVKALGPYRSKP